MSFEDFGKVSFVSETKVEGFVENLKKGRIMATRCEDCGELHFPPKMDCSNCLSSDVHWEELNGKAKLLSYTKVNFGLPDFKDDVPYVLAVAKCEEGVNVLSHLEGVDESEVEIGMDLVLEPKELPDDRITYRFKKA
ncbi:hypothetical protein AKJ37_03935 [candidate division MSBL1 archaeon SCGC-AAA259I09]|uniref:DNA-binding protein n=1 Tax=candidate division MSBL1 archaeon SCGC-AAA259I09 TaxID=1698267 RepID=A0A133US57_9EURY|nr:hypothetical protein AKJ37_03935 [candidate division MSBL1 archaeon SCGC-AAA259I09]